MSGRIRFTLLAVLFLFSLSALIMAGFVEEPSVASPFVFSTTENELDILVNEVSFELVCSKENDCQIEAEDFNTLSEPGKPKVPTRMLQLAVPPDVVRDSIKIQINDVEYVDYSVDEPISPSPLPESDEPTPIPEYFEDGMDMRVYGEDIFYPENPIHFLGLADRRKWNIAKVIVNPVRYNHVRKQVRAIKRLSATLTYSTDPQLATMLDDHVMEDVMAETLDNFEQVKEMYNVADVGSGKVEIFYPNMVIVTTQKIFTDIYNNTSYTLLDYCEYQRNHNRPTWIVTEQLWRDCEGHYGLGYGYFYSGGNRRQKIKTFLKSKLSTWNLNFVLLIGNPNENSTPTDYEVPALEIYPMTDDPGNINTTYYTDHYYADLGQDSDIDWNAGGDSSKPGERCGDYLDSTCTSFVTGALDLNPDVYVGRIPVYVTVDWWDDVSRILANTADFQDTTNQSWRNNVLLAANIFELRDHRELGACGIPCKNGTDFSSVSEAMCSDFLTDNGFSCTSAYERGCTYGDPHYEFFMPAGDSINCVIDNAYCRHEPDYYSWQLMDLLDGNQTPSSFGVLSSMSHGGIDHLNRVIWYRDYDSDTDPDLDSACGSQNEEVGYTLLTSAEVTAGSPTSLNRYFAYLASCWSGKYDDESNLAYNLLKFRSIGVVASYGSSWACCDHLGHDEEIYPPEDYSEKFCYQHLGYRIVNDWTVGNEYLGMALYENTINDGQSGYINYGCQYTNCLSFNLFGDPRTTLRYGL